MLTISQRVENLTFFLGETNEKTRRPLIVGGLGIEEIFCRQLSRVQQFPTRVRIAARRSLS